MSLTALFKFHVCFRLMYVPLYLAGADLRCSWKKYDFSHFFLEEVEFYSPIISARSRGIRAALVLSPYPSTIAIPEVSAMMFLSAEHISPHLTWTANSRMFFCAHVLNAQSKILLIRNHHVWQILVASGNRVLLDLIWQSRPARNYRQESASLQEPCP